MDARAGEAGERFVARPMLAPAEAPRAGEAPQLAVWGPLAGLLDADVTDVFVNPDGSVWVDRGTGAHLVTGLHLAPREARELATRLLAQGDRHVDEATPCADVALDGHRRVHAVLPPISAGGAALSIRQARPERWSLTQLAEREVVDEVGLDRLRELVARRANLLITGAAGSGKTTLLAALLAEAPPGERIVVVEDVAELRVAHPHVVALSARQPNLEGRGAIGLDRLVREALRMRPDRLVVGECRGPEFRELLMALNTGHDGGAGTLHANSLADVPARLEALGALAGWGPSALARQTVSAFDAVIHLGRGADGARRIEALGRLGLGARDRLAVEQW